MKKINRLKKYKKIYIALSLLFACLFGVMFATNTFAYETDAFSYSIDDLELHSNYSSWSYDDTTHTFYSPYNTNGYFQFYAYLKSTNNTTGNKAFLMNYKVYRSSDNTNWVLWQGQNANSVVSVYNTSTSTNNLICRGQTKQNSYNYNNMYTLYASPYSNNNNNIETYNNKNRVIVYGEYFSNGITNQYLKIEIINIDFIESQDITLNQYYDTYISNIEQSYNQLLDDYNELEDNYDTLYENYTQLESDYDTLQEDYDILQSDYNDLTNTDTNGLWAFFGGFSIGYVDDNNTWQTLEPYQTFEDFKNSQYNYLNGINVDLSNLKTRYPNYNKFAFVCLSNNSGSPLILDALSYKINNNGNTCQNVIVLDSIANQIQIDYTSLIQMQFNVNYQNISDNIGFYDQNKNVSILGFIFEYDNSNNFSVTSLNNEYNNGYSVGFQKGRDSLNNTISSLNNRIDTLVRQINTQQQTINSLNEQINSFSSDYNLNSLMWTIGSTPFESFKHIWNVNFLGVNIADFILGLITTFIGLYILKKFFF